MSETRPIIFNGEMVRAILDGKKTQTRRTLKYQPVDILPMPPRDNPKEKTWATLDVRGETIDENRGKVIRCRFGFLGDRLWIRETWQAQTIDDLWWHEVAKEDRPNFNWAITNPINPAFDTVPPKWLPSIHMPRWASRITLEITDVRVERVQNIKPIEVISEGIYEPHYGYSKSEGIAAILRMEQVWDSIYAKRGHSWESNPWVWVVEFEVVN